MREASATEAREAPSRWTERWRTERWWTERAFFATGTAFGMLVVLSGLGGLVAIVVVVLAKALLLEAGNPVPKGG